MRFPGRICTLLGAAALAAGCAATGATSTGSSAPSAVAVQLEVTTDRGTELRFVPDVVHAPVASTVRLTFRNVSTQSHNLTFDAPVRASTRTIVESGDSDVIEFVAPGRGRYTFVCTIHMDMKGTLVVD